MVELSSVGDGNVTDIVGDGRAGLSLVRVFVPAIGRPDAGLPFMRRRALPNPLSMRLEPPSANGRLKRWLYALAGANAPRPTSSSRLT